MLTFFVRHKKDKRNKWVASHGVNADHVASIKRAIKELRDIFNKNLRKHGLTEDQKSELYETYQLFKDSLKNGLYSDFVISEFNTPPGSIYSELPRRFMQNENNVWKIENDKLFYKKQSTKFIRTYSPKDNVEGVKVNARKIFCIGLASESFRFWYSMSNENSKRNRIDQIKVGIYSITCHRQHLRKKILWELNPRIREGYEERMAFIDEYLSIVRFCLENNPARIVTESSIVNYRTIKSEIADLNNKELNMAVASTRESMGGSLIVKPKQEQLEGVNLLQTAMGWGSFSSAAAA